MENKNLSLAVRPVWVVLQLTEKCNLRCEMCYQWGKQGALKDKEHVLELDLSTIEKVIDETISPKTVYGLFGGEPLMYSKIPELIDIIKGKGGKLYLDTNGTLLQKNAEMLVTKGVDRLWVSLDGTKEVNDKQRGKGCYDKVISGLTEINALKKAKNLSSPDLGITYIVTPTNHADIINLFDNPELLDAIDTISIEFQNFAVKKEIDGYASFLEHKFGINKVKFAKGIESEIATFWQMDFQRISDDIERLKTLAKQYDITVLTSPITHTKENIKNYFTAEWNALAEYKTQCLLPWYYIEIAANGDVVPCHTFYDFQLGNIYKESILDCWTGEKLKKLRKHCMKNLLPICTACSRYHTNLEFKL